MTLKIIDPETIAHEWIFVDLIIGGNNLGTFLYTDDGFRDFETVLNNDPSLISASYDLDHTSNNTFSFGVFSLENDLGTIHGDVLTYGYAYTLADIDNAVIENLTTLNIHGFGPKFIIPEYGSITESHSEIISGLRSIRGSYSGSDTYNDYLQTNPASLPLIPYQEYSVTFDYRILETPDKGFETIIYSPNAGSVGDYLTGTTITGTAGDHGYATFSNTLGNYTDYYVAWNIVGTGAIAIDNIRIENLSRDFAIAEEDGEKLFSLSFTQEFIGNRDNLAINGSW